jgi:molybdopterin-guanine dinucleotide biosynthesis protein A
MTLTAVLFAGGHSRRMGTDKATLTVAGEPLWARQLKVLRELQPQTIWISARERPAWCPAEIEVVLDTPPSRGPLSGLAAVLPRLRTTHLLALAIDLPEMTAEQLQKLLAAARSGCGVIPTDGNYFEPLCAIYPAEAYSIVADALAGGDVSLQKVSQTLVTLNRAREYTLAGDEKRHFLNMNSPEDWQAIEPPR